MEYVLEPASILVKHPVIDNGVGVTPFSVERINPTKEEYIQLRRRARFWELQHSRAVERERRLKQRVEELEAEVRDLKQRLYGKKSEKSSAAECAKEQKEETSRRRGQQKGSRGHGRTERRQLGFVEEERDLPEDEKKCSICQGVFEPFPGTEDSEIIEIHVMAYTRRIKRKRYKKTCQCKEIPCIITAPMAPRLIDRSPLGVSIWITILLDKYLYSRPTNRLCKDFKDHGLILAPGTIAGGLKQIAPLFKPLLEAFYLKQMTENRFNGDETRWEVFVEMEGKVGHRWYLWITKSPLVVYYRIEPSRGACVSKEHFGKLVASDKKVILVCDRYSSYKSLALENKRIKLAFCWAHVRRDFLDTARSWLVLNEWAFSWVEDIREVYRLNKQRLEVWDQTNSLKRQSPEFNKRQTALCDKLAEMEEKRVRELKEEDLRRRKKKVLTSLANHWQGLTVFVDHPEVPMDNNAAERNLRNEVVGRKNYYGSGSLWSAELAATMFTLLQTVILWKINPRHWLQAFLKACADNGGRTPEDLSSFLPWEMGEERRKELMQVPPFEGSQLLRLHAGGKGESNEPECKDTS